MRTRLLRLGLVLLSLFGCLLASADDQVVLKLWAGGGFNVPRKDETGVSARANRAVIDAFLAKHPNIKLELVSGINLQGSAWESGLLMAMAGGVGPDVIYVCFRTLYSYVDQGFLLPLDDYVSRDPNVLSSIHPNIRNVLRQEGHIYTIPYAQYVQALYYRKDLFRDAGLDPNRPPRDWNEFYEYAKRLTKPESGQYGFTFGQGSQDRGYYWVNFLWQAGGEVLEKTPSGRWKATFNSPAGVEALKFFRKLARDEWVGPDGRRNKGVGSPTGDLAKGIEQGKLGMWFNYQSTVIANTAGDAINSSLIGIAPMPKGPTGLTGNELNAAMFGINAQQKDPKVREAAWEFIRFMGSEDADRIRVKAYVENGLGNMVSPIMLKKCGYDELVTPVGEQWARSMKSLFDHGKHEPMGRGVQMIYLELDQPLIEYTLYPDRNPKEILDRAAVKVDAKLLGYTPPDIMRRRRVLAYGMVTGFGLAALAALGYGIRRRAKAAQYGMARMAGGRGWRGQIWPWLFLLPALGSIALWAYIPLLRGLAMAFQNYKITQAPQWVGVDNFIDAACQPTFWIGMANSLEFVAWTLGLGFFLPIILALLLTEIPWGKTLLRTLYYLPAVTSGLVIIFMWRQFYAPGPDGLVNQLLTQVATGWNGFAGLLHIPFLAPKSIEVDWLGSPTWAMLAAVIPGVWAGAGPGSIIYIAALKTVPESLYEAADLDGAGVWHKVTGIALPCIKPLIIINLVGAFVGAFKSMDSIFVLTSGGPILRTHVIGLEIWYNAFVYLKFGYATAAAWMMGALLIGFTLYQLRILKNVRFGAGS